MASYYDATGINVCDVSMPIGIFYMVWMLAFRFWKRRIVLTKSVFIRAAYLNSPFIENFCDLIYMTNFCLFMGYQVVHELLGAQGVHVVLGIKSRLPVCK